MNDLDDIMDLDRRAALLRKVNKIRLVLTCIAVVSFACATFLLILIFLRFLVQL